MNGIIFDQLVLGDFEQAVRKAFWRDWLSWLTRKSNDLLSFHQVRQRLTIKGQHYRGLQAVPLEKIGGSVERYLDFDRAFFPRETRTRDRWIRINKAHYEQIHLPPVELFKIGEIYFVSDGNHRISVARIWGQKFIDAYVIEINVSK